MWHGPRGIITWKATTKLILHEGREVYEIENKKQNIGLQNKSCHRILVYPRSYVQLNTTLFPVGSYAA
jgi:hypothetical protein